MTRTYSDQLDPHDLSGDTYSLPTVPPLYTLPPFEYRDGWSQLVIFKSDPAILARDVPKPLVVDPEGIMTMTISKFFTSGFGAYNESVLTTNVTFNGQPANYALLLILDSDVATGGGREIWGWPKKIGRVGLTTRDGMVTGTVERGGVQLVQATMALTELAPANAMAGGSPDFINLKLIPSVKTGAPPEVRQLTKCAMSNFVPKQIFRGRATISFGASPADRFCEFPIREVVDAFYYNSDFTLGDGDIVYDYLK